MCAFVCICVHLPLRFGSLEACTGLLLNSGGLSSVLCQLPYQPPSSDQGLCDSLEAAAGRHATSTDITSKYPARTATASKSRVPALRRISRGLPPTVVGMAFHAQTRARKEQKSAEMRLHELGKNRRGKEVRLGSFSQMLPRTAFRAAFRSENFRIKQCGVQHHGACGFTEVQHPGTFGSNFGCQGERALLHNEPRAATVRVVSKDAKAGCTFALLAWLRCLSKGICMLVCLCLCVCVCVFVFCLSVSVCVCVCGHSCTW